MKNAPVRLINETCRIAYENLGENLFTGDCGVFALALIDTFADNPRGSRLVEVKKKDTLHFAAKFGNFVFDGNGLVDEDLLIDDWTGKSKVKPRLLYHKVDHNSLEYIHNSTAPFTDYNEMIGILRGCRLAAKRRLRDRYST